MKLPSSAVDIRGWITSAGIDIVVRDDLEVDARLLRDGALWLIEVRPNVHETRQRFSLAHEFGHFQLHRHAAEQRPLNRSATSRLGTEPLEVAANQWAAEMLMPEAWVRNAVGLRVLVDGECNSALKLLARRFAVSPEALRFRLLRLNLLLTREQTASVAIGRVKRLNRAIAELSAPADDANDFTSAAQLLSELLPYVSNSVLAGLHDSLAHAELVLQRLKSTAESELGRREFARASP